MIVTNQFFLIHNLSITPLNIALKNEVPSIINNVTFWQIGFDFPKFSTIWEKYP